MKEKYSIETLINLTRIIGHYVIPSICAIGVILNLTCITILIKNKEFNLRMYKLLVFKILIETISLLIGLGFNDAICFKDCFSEYSINYYLRIFVLLLRIIAGSLFVSATLSEIGLNYERYLMLKRKINTFNKIELKYLFLVYILIGFAIFFPEIFAYKYENVPKHNNNSIFDYSSFGESDLYSYYMVISITTCNFISIVIFTAMNILLIIEYKKFVKRKSAFYFYRITVIPHIIFGDDRNYNSSMTIAANPKRSEINFTKMILILNIIFVLIRSLNLIMVVLFRKDKLNHVQMLNVSTILTRNIGFLTIFISYTINIFILIKFNRDFKNILFNCLKSVLIFFKRIFKC